MEILRQVGLAVAVLGGLGALFGLALAVANRVFYVETDSRLEPLMQALPGANCGGCGFSGCGAYAQAVLGGKAPGLMHLRRRRVRPGYGLHHGRQSGKGCAPGGVRALCRSYGAG